MITSSIAVIVSVLVGFILLFPRFRCSTQWRATVTPLASIIGSGFLIVAPLLHAMMGKWALLGIVILCTVSYFIGAIIRFNIRYAEPLFEKSASNIVLWLEPLGQWFLGAAYAISVAFYISLFAAFVFDRIQVTDPVQIKIMTSLVLLLVMVIAWYRGARGLETIELYAVSIKLAIIIGVVAALATYSWQVSSEWFQHPPVVPLSTSETLSMLAGMLMVTQGFETTRFMGDSYNAKQRIIAGKYAQWIAFALYAAFILLTCPIFLDFPIQVLNETTVSNTLGQAVWVLPVLLLIAATTSQLSAALADTIGGGGLLSELVKRRGSRRHCYVIIIGIAGVLVWSSNVFEIINLASKGFALYYLVQTLIAITIVWEHQPNTQYRCLKVLGMSIIAILLLYVIGWSIPAPHN